MSWISNNCNWVCTTDCSAKEAAEAAYQAAEAAFQKALEARDNASELNKNLQQEKTKVQGLIDDYNSTYNTLQESGGTFLTEANVSILDQGYKCLDNYLNAVSNTEQKAKEEFDKCQKEYLSAKSKRDAAKTKAANTKCVTTCGCA